MNNERYTTEALNAIEKARLSSVFHRQNYVGTEHLLVGLLKETDGTASQVLNLTAEGVYNIRYLRYNTRDEANGLQC